VAVGPSDDRTLGPGDGIGRVNPQVVAWLKNPAGGAERLGVTLRGAPRHAILPQARPVCGGVGLGPGVESIPWLPSPSPAPGAFSRRRPQFRLCWRSRGRQPNGPSSRLTPPRGGVRDSCQVEPRQVWSQQHPRPRETQTDSTALLLRQASRTNQRIRHPPRTATIPRRPMTGRFYGTGNSTTLPTAAAWARRRTSSPTSREPGPDGARRSCPAGPSSDQHCVGSEASAP
jgi:hypothetical protein